MSDDRPIADRPSAATPPWPDGERLTIPSRFALIVRHFPDRTAIRTATDRWTYRELDDRSAAIAAQLLARGLSPSQPVAIFLDHAPPLIAAILGVLRAGAIYLSLDPADNPARQQTVLADAQPRWLITDTGHEPQALELLGRRDAILNIDLATNHSTPDLPPIAPDAGAWLMYTSGSTGRPKGVSQSHRNVIHHTRVYADLASITPDDRLSMLTSAGVAASATALFAALLTGATLAMFSVRRQGIEPLAPWLDEQAVTICHLVPSVFRRLARTPSHPGRWPHLRLLRLGGEAVLQTDIELFRLVCPDPCSLMHALSSTETGLITQLTLDKSSPPTDAIIPAGRPVPGVEVLILDDAGRPCAPGRPGRIAVRSRHLAMGYWQQPDLTAAAFESLPDHPDLRQFITGDVGLIRADGNLEHHGRADRQVKVRGWRVDLAAVEANLEATPHISEAAVLAASDDRGETRLTAYVVPAPASDRAGASWHQLLRTAIPSQMMPHAFVELPALPRTPSGKIDRQALAAAPAPQPHRQPRGPSPRDHVERKVAEIWRTVLETSDIGLDDDFFDLGGDSLRGVDLLLRVEQTFDVSLSPSSLIEHPSLRAFSALVAHGSVPGTPSPLVPVRPTGHRLPLFLVHPGNGSPACFGLLARLLNPDQPVYAFRAPGLLGECWPLMSLHAMARRYVQELLTVAPHGPYLLGGRCAGGLIAIEMARRLTRAGRPVSNVILIDTPHPPPPRSAVRRFTDNLRDVLRLIRWGLLRAVRAADHPARLPRYRLFVDQMIHRAIRAYRPTPYDGHITLLIASDQEPAFHDRLMKMTFASRQPTILTIPGNHADMLRRPAVHHVASRINAWLDLAAVDSTA
ncbi:MAG: AMP-binding protein [Phycisphaeraceae bacterium]|nr:AMP-binding protein [Phycisphaeraceae bacterium]